jgi:hypothetical protein
MTKPSQFRVLSIFSWILVSKDAEYDGWGENMQEMPFCKFRV